MELMQATQTFMALGHPGRLSVFRMLMRLAPQGGRPTEIAEALAMKQNTLSHYLNDLEAAGLIKGERQGRSILYAIDLDRTGALVDYLVEDCCRGRPDLCPTPTASATAVAKGDQPYTVLFICSGNSARSILADHFADVPGLLIVGGLQGEFVGDDVFIDLPQLLPVLQCTGEVQAT